MMQGKPPAAPAAAITTPAGKVPIPTTAPPAVGGAVTGGTTIGVAVHGNATTEIIETTTSGVMALFDWNVVHMMVFALWLIYFIPILLNFLNRKQSQWWKRCTLPKGKKPSTQKN